jgi:hypothetical protein
MCMLNVYSCYQCDKTFNGEVALCHQEKGEYTLMCTRIDDINSAAVHTENGTGLSVNLSKIMPVMHQEVVCSPCMDKNSLEESLAV